MDMQQLLAAVEKVHIHFLEKNPNLDNEKQTLLRSLKLGEEVGELNEQIMGHYGYGRKEKIEKCSPTSLWHEVVDVIFTAMLIAKSLNIDIEWALKEKIATVQKRMWIE